MGPVLHLRTMHLSLANYRLRFIHPFGTAHGLRDGTDAVFVRIEHEGNTGHGEAALPPYLPYDQVSVYSELERYWKYMAPQLAQGPMPPMGHDPQLPPPARAALQMALMDLDARRIGCSVESLLRTCGPIVEKPRAMVTLGHTDVAFIDARISELPVTEVLKVKLGAANDRAVLEHLRQTVDRRFFLDANQGWTTIGEAVAAVQALGAERVVGLEQPFAKHRWDLHRALRSVLDVPIYADESVQGPDELERAVEAFDGVNLKLMKCGGLDMALVMAERARVLGLRVMLGSMSESSLGCGAMLALRGHAELIDLDGPWLLANDPFQGLRLEAGCMAVDGAVGIGVERRPGSCLDFTHIGA
jgi:L-alanine-DL-glutamate epimerase-like enolase superfamily enzyme